LKYGAPVGAAEGCDLLISEPNGIPQRVVPKARHQTGSYRILDYIERSGSKILIPPQGAVVIASLP
jgi:hypothetical protein